MITITSTCVRCWEDYDTTHVSPYCPLCKNCYCELYPAEYTLPKICVRPGCNNDAKFIFCEHDGGGNYMHCLHQMDCADRPLECLVNQFMTRNLAIPCHQCVDFPGGWFQHGYYCTKTDDDDDDQLIILCFLSVDKESVALYIKNVDNDSQMIDVCQIVYHKIHPNIFKSEIIRNGKNISMEVLFELTGQLASQLSTPGSYLQVICTDIIGKIDEFICGEGQI